MRIASYNVENLFDRAKALNLPTWEQGRPTLERHARINTLFNKPAYTDADKQEMVKLLKELGLARKDDAGKFALLRVIRGKLLRRPKTGGLEIVANKRDDWIGWVELKTEPVNELAMRHTAMVMRDLKVDVLGVIEAENRIVLKEFSALLLKQVQATPFAHVMVIDGNDERGIDVGLLTTTGHPIEAIRSHVDARDATGEIFSRDCAEYMVATSSGEQLLVLVNHFKSKGFGTASESNAKRLRQATRVAEIYKQRRADGVDHVVVLGDLNDTPDSAPLKPLKDTDLRDVSTHPSFQGDGREGTFANGTKGTKIDYVLLSPKLFGKVKGGGVFRKGVWGGKNGTLWPIYETMKSPVHAASDHAALFADVDL
jgi:endonuclease/exonuclease/phosphatase family metal-dependent hydrolase